MRTVTHREMRNCSGEILRAVAAGESVQVTNTGQVAAVICAAVEIRWSSWPAAGNYGRRADLSGIHRRTATKTSSHMLDDSRGR